MPRTETIEVYSFSELPKTHQKKAIDKLRNINVDIPWWEDIYYQVENHGYEDFYGKISSFDSPRVLEFEWLEYDIDKLASEFREYFQPVIKSCLSETSTREDWYNAHRTERMIRKMFVICNTNYRTLHGAILEPDVDDYAFHSDSRNDYCFKLATDFLYTRLQAFIKTVLQELENDYDYRVSDEAIIDTIEANDYTFIIVNDNVEIFS